jgi:hypothetical protein
MIDESTQEKSRPDAIDDRHFAVYDFSQNLVGASEEPFCRYQNPTRADSSS